MRLLFGDEARHIADRHPDDQARRRWLNRALRQLTRHVDALDTTARHKQLLMGEIEAISDLIKQQTDDPSSVFLYRALRLVIRLLGYDNGRKSLTADYWQDKDQEWDSVEFEGGDLEDYFDKDNVIAIQRSVVQNLNEKGYDDYKISVVLDKSESQIKELRRWSSRNRPRQPRAQ
ncbi:MAG: hypothetical protein GEU82_09430 [Luteitalea sp.]|nr:hypothetical protein [Luteitalea sp.]